MNAITRRKVLHASREPDRKFPWWLTALVGIISAGLFAVTIGLGVVYALYNTYVSDYVPIEGKISERYVGLTEVFDRGGPEGGVYLGALPNPNAQLLTPVPLDQVSPHLVEATVSTEDNTFFSNPGVSPEGLVRAAWENYSGGGVGSGSGGSTLTQQLVKNVYLSDDCEIVDGVRSCVAPRTLTRKVKEIAFSVELEQHYTKEQILGWYFNQISYADRYIGVEAASQGYFRKPASELTLAEAAMLAGIPAAPTAYHPRLNCEKTAENVCVLDEQGRTLVGGSAKERQIHVLNLMVAHNRLSREQADTAIAEPLTIYPATNPIKAAAWIDNQVEPRLVRMCEAGILPKLESAASCEESVHNAGYKVTSTLDWEETARATLMMQQFVIAGLQAGCECHNAAITTIDPETGQVVVYAPNIDPTWVSDRRVAGEIDQINEINQPGSSFKPAVYLSWFDTLAKTPMSSLWDTSPMKLSDPNVTEANQAIILNPRPGNGGEGLITARAALGGSQNVGAFRAAAEAGIPNVIHMAKALGITTLEQGFDPTFYDHDAIYYGPSVATGGANIRQIDMAYMNATIANMGVMVGVPALAKPFDPKDALSIAGAEGDKLDEALRQKHAFTRGHLRLPNTRTLDPVVVLEVRGIDGSVLYTHGDDLVRKPVVNAGSVWMLHSIMSDCQARFIIWPCGNSNDDLSLDFFVDGVKIPGGIKTGTQQGFQNSDDTLETWMNGYTRHGAFALWVGNSDNSLVRDGRRYGYAAANTTVRLFKNWVGQYHADLKAKGVFETPLDFESIRPANVVFKPYQSATTERGARGGCSQMVGSWQRTDIPYLGDCNGKGFMPLPDLGRADALKLAAARGIPVGPGQAWSGQVAVAGATAPPVSATPVPVQNAPTAPPAPRPSQAVPTAPPTSPAQPTPVPTKPPATQPPATQPPAPTQPPPGATAPPTTSGGGGG